MGTSLNVLVAVEDPMLCDTLVNRLAAAGHVAEHVADGRSALQAASRGGFDVAILEIALDGLDGWAVCARLRMDRRQVATRLVAISSEPNAHDLARSRRIGFDLHVGKEDWMDRLPSILQGEAQDAPARRTHAFAAAA